MCLFYFGGFPRNPVYRPIVCQLSVGERVKNALRKKLEISVTTFLKKQRQSYTIFCCNDLQIIMNNNYLIIIEF